MIQNGGADETEMLRDRRDILAAYVTVLAEPERLLQVCASAEGDDEHLCIAVAEEFRISALAAEAVIRLQVVRFTPQALAVMRAELASLERQLAAR